MWKAAQQWAWGATVAILAVAAVTRIGRAEDEDYYELMRVFVDTFEQIDRNYVKDVDRRKLVEAAVRGMLSELDPYSNYIGPDDLAKFSEEVEQEFGGIGIQVHLEEGTDELIVISPLPGSPAYKAGVLAGDRIVSIEGQPVEEFPKGRRRLDQAVKLLKGKPGVEVSIGIRHPGAEQVEEIKVTRDVIQLQTVLGDTYNPDGTWNYMLDAEDGIAYVRISHFSRRTAEELRAALRSLRKDGVRGLVLDLRFNPGGLLTAAVEVADLFLESGRIVSTEGRNSEYRDWSAKRFGTYSGFPMVVLVNRLSASASEIVSAALQDHQRAIIVGERTWGKGSVQNVVELEGGESALKLTTASYHRPSGKNIHRFPDSKETDDWGVLPNDGFEVKASDTEMREWSRYRQERDVISRDGPPASTFDDKQLSKALEYLHAELKEAPPKAAEKPEQDPKKDAAQVLPTVPRRGVA
jgi:carboxyl-terminal processing protease